MGLGNHGVQHITGFHGLSQCSFHGFAQAGFILAVDIDQRKEGVAFSKRCLQLLPADGGLHKAVPHQLKRGHAVTEMLLHALQHSQRFVKARHGSQCRHLGTRLRTQAQQHARNHPQRAFRTDEEVLEVIARVVLDHGAQHGQHRAVGQHHLQAQHLLTHHAVLQHTVAARIGGDIAANLAAAACAQVHAKHHAGFHSRFLHRLQCGTSLHRHQHGAGVDVFDGVHALHGNGNATLHGHGRAGQPRQAALRHNGNAMLMTQAQRCADFFGGAGAHQRQGLHRRRAAPVRVVARFNRITSQNDIRSEAVLQGNQEFLLRHIQTFHCRHCAMYQSCLDACLLTSPLVQCVPGPWFSSRVAV